MHHGLNHLAQKREKVGLVLTGARIEEGERRRRSTSCSGGEVGAAHVEKGVAGVGVGEERPEEAPGGEAELVRCPAGAPVWRSGVAAAAQSGGTAELRCCGG